MVPPLSRKGGGSLPCTPVTMGQVVILSEERCTDRARLAQAALLAHNALYSILDYAVSDHTISAHNSFSCKGASLPPSKPLTVWKPSSRPKIKPKLLNCDFESDSESCKIR